MSKKPIIETRHMVIEAMRKAVNIGNCYEIFRFNHFL
jgi:hypothetical protein